jgi:hypothetical protein
MQSKSPTEVTLASQLQRVYNEFRARVDTLTSEHGLSLADARADALLRLSQLCSRTDEPFGVKKVLGMINDGSLWKTAPPAASSS